MASRSAKPNRIPPWLQSKKRTPYLFLLPALIIFAVFMVYPILYSFGLSFQSQINPDSGFSFDNYQRLFRDTVFRQALVNTIFLLLYQVPIQLGLAMLLAVFLNSTVIRSNVVRSAFRLIYFLPAVTALFAVAIVFRILLNDEQGLVNYVLDRLGLEPVPWLTSRWGAKVSLAMAITWRWTGYNMIIYLAGLQGIPRELYEAAEIDGADGFDRFMFITLPLMKPTILLTTVLSTIGTLQIFDEPFLLTRSGPSNQTLSLATLLYRTAFQQIEANYASAIAYAMVFIIICFSILQFRIAQKGAE